MAKGGSWGEVRGLLLKTYGESEPKASNPTIGGCFSALQSLRSPSDGSWGLEAVGKHHRAQPASCIPGGPDWGDQRAWRSRITSRVSPENCFPPGPSKQMSGIVVVKKKKNKKNPTSSSLFVWALTILVIGAFQEGLAVQICRIRAA